MIENNNRDVPGEEQTVNNNVPVIDYDLSRYELTPEEKPTKK